MNQKVLLLWLIAILLLGCSPSAVDIQTAIAQTEAANPTNTIEPTSTPVPTMTLTHTPEPSPTLEPSPTPKVLPDVLDKTFSGITIVYRDEFDAMPVGQAPEGWEAAENNSLKRTENNNLEISAKIVPGMVFYYPGEVINPGEGVYFTFKYVGTQGAFTFGFDNIRENGELIQNGENGFHSVSMLMNGQTLSAHNNQNAFQGDENFKGSIKLQEDTWYQAALGFDEKGDYIIKIWNPNTPTLPLVYSHNWADFPTDYYFISWVSNLRTLWMDDFTIFKFDSIIQE